MLCSTMSSSLCEHMLVPSPVKGLCLSACLLCHICRLAILKGPSLYDEAPQKTKRMYQRRLSGLCKRLCHQVPPLDALFIPASSYCSTRSCDLAIYFA